jgi:hypothetical protein
MALQPYASNAAGAAHGALIPIAHSVVTNTTTNDITFTNIPQTFRDLMCVFYGRRTDTATTSTVFMTGYSLPVVGSPLSTTLFESDGATVYAARYSTQSGIYAGIVPADSAPTGVFGTVVGHFLNYASTTTYKTSLYRSAADINGGQYTRASTRVGLNQQTAAIERINVTTFNGSVFFAPGTTVTLYGIRGVGQ